MRRRLQPPTGQRPDWLGRFVRLRFSLTYDVGRGAPEWPGFTPPRGLKLDRPIHTGASAAPCVCPCARSSALPCAPWSRMAARSAGVTSTRAAFGGVLSTRCRHFPALTMRRARASAAGTDRPVSVASSRYVNHSEAGGSSMPFRSLCATCGVRGNKGESVAGSARGSATLRRHVCPAYQAPAEGGCRFGESEPGRRGMGHPSRLITNIWFRGWSGTPGGPKGKGAAICDGLLRSGVGPAGASD